MSKKRFASVLLALVLLASLSVSAYAHGCRGRGAGWYADASCAVCTLEDCALTGRHSHDGVVYCGYAHDSGICDGQCRALCTVEGCTLTGRHSHDGLLCCGYGHDCGFCDGSCQTAAVGHHGHHGHC